MILPDVYIKKKNENIDVFIIGYRGKGESIVVRIGNNYAGVIDSYKCGGNFLTKDILDGKYDGKKIDKLMFLCWTHPDMDHTMGLSELFQYVGDNTRILIPCGISKLEIESCLKYAKRKSLRDEYLKVFEEIQKRKDSLYLLEVNHTSSLDFLVKYRNGSYPCRLKVFSPITGITRDQQLENIKAILSNKKFKEHKNYYSIAVKLSIGTSNINLCFTGDLDDDTMNYFIQSKDYYKKVIMDNNHVYKIPHHGSKKSSLALEYVSSFDYAISTCYRGRGNLPNQEIIDLYSKCHGKLYLTRKDSPSFDYGMVHISIPLFDPKNSKCTELYDAYCYK